MEDIKKVTNQDLPWEKLQNKKVLITGASGMIGSFFVDVLMYLNRQNQYNCKIYALGRNESRARQRFTQYWSDNLFNFIQHDINNSLDVPNLSNVDFVLHLASNTHPLQYAGDPIGTITTNIIGTNNLLSFASKSKGCRFVFASSNEVYGENKGDIDLFFEDYMGYINSNTLRAGYPESKRAGEALCQAYRKANNLDIVIPRFTRTYGPTMMMTDSKAISQFIKNALNGENIILKSEGLQNYSYTYVSDAVAGLFTIMLNGKDGEAYNIADTNSNITLKDLAKILAKISHTNVVHEFPDKKEAAGYSKATKALLDGTKLRSLGWRAKYNIKQGLYQTISILNRNGEKNE